jgi:Amino acid permease
MLPLVFSTDRHRVIPSANATLESKSKRPHLPKPLRIDSGRQSNSSADEGDLFLPRSLGAIQPRILPGQKEDGKLSTFSAVNIILRKTIGVGVYSVPSSIFAGVGLVGMTLLWILGCCISFCGLAVYLDLGSALPFSGGECVYLERIYRQPRMLATCMFMAYVVLLGLDTPNCIVLGEYAQLAVGLDPTLWTVRATAVVVTDCRATCRCSTSCSTTDRCGGCENSARRHRSQEFCRSHHHNDPQPLLLSFIHLRAVGSCGSLSSYEYVFTGNPLGKKIYTRSFLVRVIQNA